MQHQDGRYMSLQTAHAVGTAPGVTLIPTMATLNDNDVSKKVHWLQQMHHSGEILAVRDVYGGGIWQLHIALSFQMLLKKNYMLFLNLPGQRLQI